MCIVHHGHELPVLQAFANPERLTDQMNFAVACLESSSDRHDRAFQFGRHLAGDLMGSMAEVEASVGAKFEVSVPPLVESARQAVQGAANRLDCFAGQAHFDRLMANGEQVKVFLRWTERLMQ
jgi:hypothetical protein